MLLEDLIENEFKHILQQDWYDADACLLYMFEERYTLLEEKISLEDITVGKDYINDVSVDFSEKFTYYCELYYPELLI